MIVDFNYYIGIYGENSISENDFKMLNVQAQPLIEVITKHNEKELLAMEEDIVEAVKKAICSQISYFKDNGGMSVMNGNSSNLLTSESYGGSYSYSKQENQALNKIKYVNGIPVAPMVYVYLLPTNLLYAGVDVYYEY